MVDVIAPPFGIGGKGCRSISNPVMVRSQYRCETYADITAPYLIELPCCFGWRSNVGLGTCSMNYSFAAYLKASNC